MLKDYGLTGDELESTYYVSPQINKSWDQFTQKQGELIRPVYDTQVAWPAGQRRLPAARGDRCQQRGSPGDPVSPGRDADHAEIDKNLSLLGGEDRRNAWEAMKKNLAYLYDQGFLALQAIQKSGLAIHQWSGRSARCGFSPTRWSWWRCTASAIELRSENYERRRVSSSRALTGLAGEGAQPWVCV